MKIGAIIHDHYQIEQVLGQGGIGITYKAFDLQTHHPVAFKQLHLSLLQDWKALEMFEREASILQHLNHPRIPRYLDYFSIESASDVQFILIQEYIEGQTLHHVIETGWEGSEIEILDLFRQLVDILGYLHALQPPVIHRDIHPKNLILSPANELYLVDFSAVQEKVRTTFHGGSTIVGTYGYVPFEQFNGQTVPASDYYAAGATLLYLLTHKHPADFPMQQLKPRFPSDLQTSPNILRLLDGLLEPSVSKRIASPEAVRAVLAQAAPQASLKVTTSGKPSKTQVKKQLKQQDHLLFRIPSRKTIGTAFLFGISLFWLISQMSIFINPLSWGQTEAIGAIILAFVVFSATTYRIGKYTVLELTPEWIRVSHKSCGIGTSQRIPTNSLRVTDLEWSLENNTPVLIIHASEKILKLSSKGLKLTQADIEWLTQEIREYLLTHTTSVL